MALLPVKELIEPSHTFLQLDTRLNSIESLDTNSHKNKVETTGKIMNGTMKKQDKNMLKQE